MYDSYEPPDTIEGVRMWLASSLKPVDVNTLVRGEFKQILGFRYAFNILAIYQSVRTGQFVWHVSEHPEDEELRFPNHRFPSVDAAIADWASFYGRAWKLKC